jgi:hypothetical protein
MKTPSISTITMMGAVCLASAPAWAQAPGGDSSPPPAVAPAAPPEATPRTTVPPYEEVPPAQTQAPVGAEGEMSPPATAPVAPVGPAPTDTPADDMSGARRMWMQKVGGAVLLGGGYEDFTYSDIRSMTGGAGAWDARLVGGTRQFVGLEAAYVGSARSIQTLGLASDSNLVSNGAEGALRLNAPIARGASLIEPFGFIGLGWQRYHVTNTPEATSDVSRNDDVMTMPLGGGVEYGYRQLLVDARFTWRATYLNDLLRTTGGKLNTWGVGGNVGVAF